MANPPKDARQRPASKPQGRSEGQDSGSGRHDDSRVLPHSSEAELAVLASMAMNPDGVAADAIQRFGLNGDAFYEPAHAAAYVALADLWTDRKPIDETTLGVRLRELKTLDTVGGESFVGELFNFLPNTSNFAAYAAIVAEKSILRTLIGEGTEIVSKAYDDSGDVPALLHDFEQMLFAVTDRSTSGKRAKTTRELVLDYIESLQNPESIFGISTGFPALDEIVGGLAPTAKIVLTAPTSGGKSSFAANIAVSTAVKRKIPTAIFTFEMTDKQTVGRCIQTHAQVSAKRVARGKANEVQMRWFTKAAEEVANSPLFIVNERLDIAGIRARVMQLCVKENLRVAIIDYLQIVPEKKQRGESTTDKLDRMSSETKQIANDTGITLIELSQQTKKEDGSFATRGSSGITNDADQLWTLEDNAKAEGWKNLVIGKQRDGEVGEVEFVFHDEITRFVEVTAAHRAGLKLPQ